MATAAHWQDGAHPRGLHRPATDQATPDAAGCRRRCRKGRCVCLVRAHARFNVSNLSPTLIYNALCTCSTVYTFGAAV